MTFIEGDQKLTEAEEQQILDTKTTITRPTDDKSWQRQYPTPGTRDADGNKISEAEKAVQVNNS